MAMRRYLLAFLAMVSLVGMRTEPPRLPVINPPHVIRFRVIANSDNPVDQAVKLDVRDRVLKTLEPLLGRVRNRHLAAQRIERVKGKLIREANRVLAAQHVEYHAKITWTTTLFPTKAYGTWVLPAGRYQALLITLGRGQGHNWWCVLYPSLCFVDMGNALAVRQPIRPLNTAILVHSSHRRPKAPPRRLSGRIRVSWTTPRFLRVLLAILH